MVADFVGESCSDQIEEGVMLLVAREGNERGLGARDGLTGANRGGGRGGSGRPELGEETSSRSSEWPSVVLVRSGDEVCTRLSSGALFIGGPRRLP